MEGAKARRGRPVTGRALSAAERMRRHRARRRAAGFKTVTRWDSTLGRAPVSPGVLKHRVVEARSLAMHCLIAAKIMEDPALLDRARRNLGAWRARYGERVPRALEEWRRILARTWPEIADLITDPGEKAARLRQSSPFAGILTPRERRRVYDAFRA